MNYDDVYITLASAIAEFESVTNHDDSTIFMSRNYYKKCNALMREQIIPDPIRVTFFCGRPIEIVDVPGDKLWVGMPFPIKEGI